MTTANNSIKAQLDAVDAEDSALNAMCIWEYALESVDKTRSDTFHDWLVQPEGRWQGRNNALDLAALAQVAWQEASELGYEDAFDWEFIPALCEFLQNTFAQPAYVHPGPVIPWARELGDAAKAAHERTVRIFNRRRECPSCFQQTLKVTEIKGSPETKETLDGHCENNDCGFTFANMANYVNS